jgi:hypothetical protein
MGATWVPFAVADAVTAAIIGGIFGLITTAATVAMWWIDRKSRQAGEKIVEVIFVPIEKSADAIGPVITAQILAEILSARQG